jgi:hypothetical protein
MASGGRLNVSIPRAFIKASVALALTSVMFLRPNSPVAVSEPKPGSAENRDAAEESKPKDLQSEIEALKTENAAVRELLRKMEEQQKILLEQVDRLQRARRGRKTDVPAKIGAEARIGRSNTPEAVIRFRTASVARSQRRSL